MCSRRVNRGGILQSNNRPLKSVIHWRNGEDKEKVSKSRKDGVWLTVRAFSCVICDTLAALYAVLADIETVDKIVSALRSPNVTWLAVRLRGRPRFKLLEKRGNISDLANFQ